MAARGRTLACWSDTCGATVRLRLARLLLADRLRRKRVVRDIMIRSLGLILASVVLRPRGARHGDVTPPPTR